MSLTFAATDIQKQYAGKPVLSGCSSSFGPHGVYALMGANGSGKSTFLRICALLEEPDAGSVSYESGGISAPCDLTLMRRITLLLPDIGVFTTSVWKNAAYGVKVRGTGGSELRERVEQALALVGLADKRDQNARTLSSGEARRLGIARALATAPEVLFLDEPTASIDRENTEIIENIIRGMKANGGPLVVLTTHDRQQAERLADWLLVIENGLIRAG